MASRDEYMKTVADLRAMSEAYQAAQQSHSDAVERFRDVELAYANTLLSRFNCSVGGPVTYRSRSYFITSVRFDAVGDPTTVVLAPKGLYARAVLDSSDWDYVPWEEWVNEMG